MENEQLRQDLHQLKAKYGKQEYRLEHLKGAVRDGDVALVEALKATPDRRQQLLDRYEPLMKMQGAPNGKQVKST